MITLELRKLQETMWGVVGCGIDVVLCLITPELLIGEPRSGNDSRSMLAYIQPVATYFEFLLMGGFSRDKEFGALW